MIVIDHTASYAHPASQVAAALADLTGYPAWQTDVLDVTPEDTAPLAAGTRIKQTRKVMGRRTEVALAVTDYAPGQHITLQTDPGTRPGVKQSYVVREEGATASRVEFRLELDGVPKLAEHLARAQLGKQVPAMFERLGSVLDGV
jgi:hypothetical protein